MDSIEITLITEEHGSVIIPLYLGEEETFSGGDCVFNDEVYTFSISSGYGFRQNFLSMRIVLKQKYIK